MGISQSIGGNNMNQYEAPHVNGVMELTETKSATIKGKLLAIQEAFEPSHEQPVADTFYIVSTYNKENPSAPINGDTAQAILAEGEANGEGS
jgi:hypothetical protein